jgi:hypothetical protein
MEALKTMLQKPTENRLQGVKKSSIPKAFWLLFKLFASQ